MYTLTADDHAEAAAIADSRKSYRNRRVQVLVAITGWRDNRGPRACAVLNRVYEIEAGRRGRPFSPVRCG